MNDKREDEFTPEERALLSQWRAPSPPPGFAERVLASSRTAEPQARRRRPLIAAAAVLLALIGGSIALYSSGAESRGEQTVASRTTLALGDRAVAVAEAGAHLKWIVSANGEAVIDQDRGDVFYRVDDGGSFVVNTPEGTVRVVGTCFRVEVETMQATKAGLMGAAAGAAVTAAVLITVYEGQVVTASELGAKSVGPGETVKLEDGRPPLALATADLRDPRTQRKSPELAASKGLSDVAAAQSALTEAEKNAPLPLRLETERLRTRVAELETQLAEVQKKSRAKKTYDIPQEELELMASKCELRWDMPSLGAEPDTLGEEEVAQLGLSAEDRKKVDALMAEHHKEMRAQIEKLYSEATGDPNPSGISMDAMINEVHDKTPNPDMKALFQKLAKERAGQLGAPDPAVPQSPAERMMRLLTNAGDRFESKIGSVLGPDMAHGIRDMNGGWGSRSSSSYGCPKVK